MDMGIYQTRHDSSSRQVHFGVCTVTSRSYHPSLFYGEIRVLPFTGERVEDFGAPENRASGPVTMGRIDKTLPEKRIWFSHGHSICTYP